MKNVNGNILDKAICEEIKKLGEDGSEFVKQLELGKKQLEGNRDEYERALGRLEGELAENDKVTSAFVTTLVKAAGTPSEDYILEQIDEQHKKSEAIKTRIAELKSLTATHALSDIEFDIIRQMLSNVRNTIDYMDVEQKRSAMRSFIKKIVWDGTNIHVYLFGSDDGSGVELPFIATQDSDDELEPICENSK